MYSRGQTQPQVLGPCVPPFIQVFVKQAIGSWKTKEQKGENKHYAHESMGTSVSLCGGVDKTP